MINQQEKPQSRKQKPLCRRKMIDAAIFIDLQSTTEAVDETLLQETKSKVMLK